MGGKHRGGGCMVLIGATLSYISGLIMMCIGVAIR